VPLILSQGRGTWSVLGGDVTVDGALSVADEADPARFHPLVTNDFHLTLIDDQIVAKGWLIDQTPAPASPRQGSTMRFTPGAEMRCWTYPASASTKIISLNS
jgi:hypothetical protein